MPLYWGVGTPLYWERKSIVIPTGAGANATAQRRNLLFLAVTMPTWGGTHSSAPRAPAIVGWALNPKVVKAAALFPSPTADDPR